MSAFRILLLVLALAAVAFVARYALTSAATSAAAESAQTSGGQRSAPARQLDNVRQKARAIEGEMQKSMEKAEKPAEEGAQ